MRISESPWSPVSAAWWQRSRGPETCPRPTPLCSIRACVRPRHFAFWRFSSAVRRIPRPSTSMPSASSARLRTCLPLPISARTTAGPTEQAGLTAPIACLPATGSNAARTDAAGPVVPAPPASRAPLANASTMDAYLSAPVSSVEGTGAGDPAGPVRLGRVARTGRVFRVIAFLNARGSSAERTAVGGCAGRVLPPKSA